MGKKQKHQKWEYLTKWCQGGQSRNKTLQEYGEQGWEAFSIIEDEKSYGPCYFIYFKRPKL